MTDLFNIENWKAIVTGGTRGLGYGMAEGLLESGAEVVIFGTSDKVEQVAADFCGKGYHCHHQDRDYDGRHGFADPTSVLPEAARRGCEGGGRVGLFCLFSKGDPPHSCFWASALAQLQPVAQGFLNPDGDVHGLKSIALRTLKIRK